MQKTDQPIPKILKASSFFDLGNINKKQVAILGLIFLVIFLSFQYSIKLLYFYYLNETRQNESIIIDTPEKIVPIPEEEIQLIYLQRLHVFYGTRMTINRTTGLGTSGGCGGGGCSPTQVRYFTKKELDTFFNKAHEYFYNLATRQNKNINNSELTDDERVSLESYRIFITREDIVQTSKKDSNQQQRISCEAEGYGCSDSFIAFRDYIQNFWENEGLVVDEIPSSR